MQIQTPPRTDIPALDVWLERLTHQLSMTWAEWLAKMSGEAGAAFDFNAQNLTGVSGITIDAGATPTDSQFLIQANGAGGISLFTYSADSNFLLFDAIYDNGSKSLDSGSNFGIIKYTDLLKFAVDSGITVGNTITWDIGLTLDTSRNFNIVAHNASTVGLKLGGTLVTASAAEINQLDDNTLTNHLTLHITDTDGDTEGDIWYDASDDKLKFKTAAGVETITSA